MSTSHGGRATTGARASRAPVRARVPRAWVLVRDAAADGVAGAAAVEILGGDGRSLAGASDVGRAASRGSAPPGQPLRGGGGGIDPPSSLLSSASPILLFTPRWPRGRSGTGRRRGLEPPRTGRG